MPMLSDRVLPELRRIREELDKLGVMKIHVGIQGGVKLSGEKNGKVVAVDVPATVVTIAGVHEYGMTIRAKNVKNLTVPISKNAKGRRAGEFNNLFVYTADSGERFLVREKSKNSLEFMYWLTPVVTIPERSFIRSGYDNGKDTIYRAQEKAISGIIRSGWTAKEAAEYIGLYAVKVVKEYFTKGNMREKSSATLAASPTKTTPLVDSGRLRNSITFTIEEG